MFRLATGVSLLLVGSCGGGGGSVPASIPPVLFNVTTTDPRPGTGSLSDMATITVLFTKAVDSRSLTGEEVKVTNVVTNDVEPGSLTLSGDARRITWKPASRLDLKTKYRLDVSPSLLDQDGSPLVDSFTAYYTTGSFPTPAFLRQSDFRTLTSHMRTGRSDHTLTLVAGSDGTQYVLIAGGFTVGRSAPTASAERVRVSNLAPDKDDGHIFQDAGTLSIPRAYHTATALGAGSGRVLIAGGGTDTYGTTAVSDCQIWDLTTNQFSMTGSLNIARRLHAATLIEATGTDMDGKVLITGGLPLDIAGDTAEVYDPGTGKFTLLPARMHDVREGHEAILLKRGPLAGKVLIAGGGTDVAEIFDPATKTFTEISDLTNSFRWMFGLVELTTGQVLLTDGGEQVGELFNPYTHSFDQVPSANRLERYAPVVFRFSFPPSREPASGGPADNVLILGGAKYLGGSTPWLANADVEQFILGTSGTGAYYSSDPAEGGIDLGDPRAFSAGCGLGDGRLLVTGGIPSSAIGTPPSNLDLDTVLLFDPQP